MKPLFIPLKSEYYDAFAAGYKQIEFRKYGPRWNERTCPVGRPVILSRGYGRQHRMTGKIVMFHRRKWPTKTDVWKSIYGDTGGFAACIEIRVARGSSGSIAAPSSDR